eukprot:TRINITY_DN2590_c0_g1_i1.p1 TRINITY_DN2590_c0_g1~~TRINITY_DN2590_c0_g1_i1.p1  ORF type:complete len:686 (-),score=177.15 TRINITY_DN2590_c0_g1_i1:213-2051(-)
MSLLVLPLLTIPASAVITFGLTYWLAKLISIAAFVAAVVMSIVVALCIDYALFLCSRYNEALRAGLSNSAAVWQALFRSGENILVSGSTIAVSLLGLAVFPVTDIRSQGLGAALGVVVTVAVNMTVIPAMLLCFGRFFGRKPSTQQQDNWLTRWMKGVQGSNALDSAAAPPSALERAAKARSEQESSRFLRLALFTRDHPWLVIITVLAVGVPFMVAFADIQVSFDIMSFTPRDSPAVKTIRHLQEVWGNGITAPYYLVVETGRPFYIKSPHFWDASEQLLLYLNTTVPEVPLSAYNSVRMAQGTFVTPLLRDSFLNVQHKDALSQAYQTLWNRTVNPAESAMFFLISVPFDGLGSEAVAWIRHMRSAIGDFQRNVSPREALVYNISLQGGAVSQVDVLDLVSRDLPLMAALTFGVIMLIVAVAFRSVVLPFIFVLAMMYTLGVTFGLATMVFGSLQWSIPVMSFSLICGLSLDYGVFLLTRVKEYRYNAFTEEAAVVKGVYKTGGVITSAGIIMFIAIGGLMLSSAQFLNEFGLLLSFSVLIDTFVIRCAFVPALLFLVGKAAWWPAQPPAAYRRIDDMYGDVADEALLSGVPSEDDDDNMAKFHSPVASI